MKVGEQRAEHVRPGSVGVKGEKEIGGGRGQGGEVAQTMYIHMN
jgi:hypothetical protein